MAGAGLGKPAFYIAAPVMDSPAREMTATESVAAFARRVLRIDIQRCPIRHAGHWRCIATVPRARGPP